MKNLLKAKLEHKDALATVLSSRGGLHRLSWLFDSLEELNPQSIWSSGQAVAQENGDLVQ